MKLDKRIVTVLFLLCAAAVLCLMAAAPVVAQCAMCRASVTNNAAFVKGLNLGVLVLLTPPVAIFCSIFIVAYRHRKGGKDGETSE